MTLRLYVSPEAESDIEEILEWSVGRFGVTVRDGYEELIKRRDREPAARP